MECPLPSLFSVVKQNIFVCLISSLEFRHGTSEFLVGEISGDFPSDFKLHKEHSSFVIVVRPQTKNHLTDDSADLFITEAATRKHRDSL